MNFIQTGLTEDQSKLVTSILILFPLGVILTTIRTPSHRLIFSALPGLLIQFYMYSQHVLHIIASSVIVLAIIKLSSRKHIGFLVGLYAFTHLSLLHLYRLVYDYAGWKMDITLIFMNLTLKYTAFGFNVYDGFHYERLNKYRKPLAVREFNLAFYFGYVFFFPTSLMGPFIEFNDYLDFIHLRNNYDAVPSTILPGLKRMGQALITAVLYLSLKDVFTVNYFLGLEPSPWKFMAFCILLFQKYKYYIAFLLSESICIASGFSYDRKSREFNRVVHVRVLPCETGYSAKRFFQNWNISTHNFLKKYVYFRLSEGDITGRASTSGSRAFAQAMTFALSAFWHGFYPCYYILFFHFAVGMAVEMQFELLKERHLRRRLFRDMLDWLFKIGFFFIGNYCVGIVEALDYPIMFRFLRECFYGPSIVVLAAYGVNFLIIRSCERRRSESKGSKPIEKVLKQGEYKTDQ